MSDYYILSADSEAQDQVALATHPAEASRFTRRLRHRPGPRDSAPFLQWQMPTTDVFDWPWNDNGACVLSDRARSVLEPLLGPDDHIQWLPASMLTPDGEPLPYWVAHFDEPLDIYHDALTDRGPSPIPYRWTLSLSKAAGHHVFAPPSRGNLVIVSVVVADAIRAANLTGISLTACPAA